MGTESEFLIMPTFIFFPFVSWYRVNSPFHCKNYFASLFLFQFSVFYFPFNASHKDGLVSLSKSRVKERNRLHKIQCPQAGWWSTKYIQSSKAKSYKVYFLSRVISVCTSDHESFPSKKHILWKLKFRFFALTDIFLSIIMLRISVSQILLLDSMKNTNRYMPILCLYHKTTWHQLLCRLMLEKGHILS